MPCFSRPQHTRVRIVSRPSVSRGVSDTGRAAAAVVDEDGDGANEGVPALTFEMVDRLAARQQDLGVPSERVHPAGGGRVFGDDGAAGVAGGGGGQAAGGGGSGLPGGGRSTIGDQAVGYRAAGHPDDLGAGAAEEPAERAGDGAGVD
jgi:hypothetical protein